MPKKFVKSFKYAQAGISHALKTQRNLWIHFALGLLVLVVSFLLNVSYVELAILVITIFFVIVVEVLNTAIEEIVNVISPAHRLEAKLAKDVAAAAVLLSAIGAVIIGIIILMPRLIT